MVKIGPSVLFYIGDEKYLKEIALDELKSSILDSSSKELDYKVFYGGDNNAIEILDYITTFPFFAKKRLAVIKDFEKLPQEDRARLFDYIKKPSKSTCLVVEARSDSAIKEDPSIMRHIKVERFDNLTGSRLASWIREYLSLRGKAITADAIEIVKELQGENLASVTREMEKLTAFVGGRKDIEAMDVEEVVGRSLTRSAFDIAWMTGARNTAKALRLVSDLMMCGKKPEDIIGILCWLFKALLRAKLLKAKGKTDYAIANNLGLYKERQDEFFRNLKTFDITQLKSKLKILLDADLDIKRTRFDRARLLEFAVIRLCLG
jgi:DNA polymerase-3 subunit delta